MIAFKPQSLNPQKPAGMPDEWPWNEAVISQEQVATYQLQGWTVMDASAYVLYKATYQAAFDAWYNALPKELPPAISPRQIRIALLNQGITASMIESSLNSLEEPQKSIALIEWEYATEFKRNHPLVPGVAAALGWNDEQLDDLWAYAITL